MGGSVRWRYLTGRTIKDGQKITRSTGNQMQVERDRDKKKKYIRPLNLVKVVKRVYCKAFRDNVLNFKPGYDLVPSAVAVETECEQPEPREKPHV